MENVVGPEPPGHQDGQTLPAVFIDDDWAFSMMGMGETRAYPETNSLPSKINTLARCEAGFFLPKRVANRYRRKPWISGHFQTLPKIPCNTGELNVHLVCAFGNDDELHAFRQFDASGTGTDDSAFLDHETKPPRLFPRFQERISRHPAEGLEIPNRSRIR